MYAVTLLTVPIDVYIKKYLEYTYIILTYDCICKAKIHIQYI